MAAEPAGEEGKEGSRDAQRREGHGIVAQVQGPLQLSSTARAWKEALGEVDVGKWDLIYRQGPVQCPMRCLSEDPVHYPVQCPLCTVSWLSHHLT